MGDKTSVEKQKNEQLSKFQQEFDLDEREEWCNELLENGAAGSYTRELSREEIRAVLAFYRDNVL